MSDIGWKNEIEKKYRLHTRADFMKVKRAAEGAGFELLSGTLQRDWMPDFSDWLLKRSGILLRIRYLTYEVGSGPTWLVTVKLRSVSNKVHHNKELEASSDHADKLNTLEKSLYEACGTNINLRRVIENDSDYIQSIHLTTHRMLIEKRRYEYKSPDNNGLLALDELPSPLGYFAELESSQNEKAIATWEPKLGLDHFDALSEDYGELVKALQPDRNLRTLVFHPANT